MLPRRRDGEEMVLEDTGPSGSYTLVGVSYLARPISAYPITHGNGRNYGTQAIIHGVPIIPRHGRPRRERETRPYPLDIQASISLSLSLFPFSFCEAEVSSKSVFLFINSSSFFSRRRSTLMHRERFIPLIPFSHSFLYFFFERIYIGEGDRVNERLRVMKMSVRGDVERAAWKG